MIFRKKHTARRPDAPQPVDRGYAETLQRRAGDLAEHPEKQSKNSSSARLRRFQCQQVERQMAGLRSEAVRARRLAEHIENLSRDTTAQQHRRKPVMTDTNIVDPGHAQRLKRRADDRPAPGGSQLSFNPLHPSMELPPEQLIRLLGMENKKNRTGHKRRKPARATSTASTPAATAASTTERQAQPRQPQVAAASRKQSRPPRSMPYEDAQAPVFDSERRNLLVPALLVGVVAGIAVSAYLLWSQPVPVAKQKPATVSSAPAPKPLTRKPTATAKPAAAPAPAMSIKEQAQWQDDIRKETRRLQGAAEQRLAERIRQLEARTAVPAEQQAAVPPPAAQPAIDENGTAGNTLETAAPTPEPAEWPADSVPEVVTEALPGNADEVQLNEAVTETATTPDTPQAMPAELPAETELPPAAAAYTAPPPAEEPTPLMPDSMQPEVPGTETLQDLEASGTPQPEATFALPEQPDALATPAKTDTPASL